MREIYHIADAAAFNSARERTGYDFRLLTDFAEGLDVSPFIDRIAAPPGKYPLIVYAKFFVPFFSKEPYSIYMDLDTEILSDISELRTMEFKETMAAVYPYRSHPCYFNTGVLVFNNEKYKRLFTIDSIVKFINEYRHPVDCKAEMSDEPVFNSMVKDVRRLDRKYNWFGRPLRPRAAIWHKVGNGEWRKKAGAGQWK